MGGDIAVRAILGQREQRYRRLLQLITLHRVRGSAQIVHMFFDVAGDGQGAELAIAADPAFTPA